MAVPVSVVLDRAGYGIGSLDLSPLVADGSLSWSSVIPGGFASCQFTLNGDFRTLTAQVPYLALVRVIGDSGRVLFEGQIEDKSPQLSGGQVSLQVGAYGLQNVLRETSVRQIWSKRDMNWVDQSALPGSVVGGNLTADATNFSISSGNFDPTTLTKSGVQIVSNGGVSVPATNGHVAEWIAPSGITVAEWIGTFAATGTDSAASKWTLSWYALEAGTWTLLGTSILAGPTEFVLGPGTATALRVGVFNHSGSPATLAAGNTAQFYNMRALGVITTEDSDGGFYGGTLINSLLGFVGPISPGVVEAGTDFLIDHLDASVRRQAYDILTEIAQYYAREWAVWEDALLHWRTPNLTEPGWLIPVGVLASLNLDASVQNSQATSYILYTDAGSGLTAEANVASTDRRNPYVINGRAKDQLNSESFVMTANTSVQLAGQILQDIGFGPVPAAGSISLPGETIVSHTSQSAKKAWEVRAGDNVTIPELPLADVFTQDGRGESTFHVVSAEADGSTGLVTLSLDSYGSKRSDVLLARLAAVTSALGG